MSQNICRICLIAIKDEKSKVIIEGSTRDVFIFVFPSLHLEGHTLIICNICSTKLLHAYNFKAACQETEDIIAPYVNSEKVLMRDFKAIYIIDKIEKGYGSINSALEDLKVCRLCMQLVSDKFIRVEDDDQIGDFILEVQNFTVTSESIICLKCSDSLTTTSNFIKNCLSKQIDSYIKCEEIHIKSEEENDNDESTETELDVSFDTTKQMSVNSAAQMYKCDKCPYENKQKRYLKSHELVHKDKYEVATYKCGECKFESKRRNDLYAHQVIHKSPSEVQIYKCTECAYESKRKQYLKNHLLKHRDPTYKCDKCHFMTKYRGNFATHQKLHDKYTYTCHKCGLEKTLKRASNQEAEFFECNTCRNKTPQKQHETNPTYKCDKCKFTTTCVVTFITHQEQHVTHPSYKCGKCKFTTTYRGTFVAHQKQHEKYKCDKCTFATKYKGTFATHQKQHETYTYTCHKCGLEETLQQPFKRKNSVEVRMFKCNSCRNETPQADPSVLQMHKCNECDFETEFRQKLIIHQSSHNVAWGVQRYKCEECDVESRFKVIFQLQLSKHQDPSTGPMYKCTECTFETQLKDSLRVHLLRHQDPSEVCMYKCDKCKTKPNEVLDADVPMK